MTQPSRSFFKRGLTALCILALLGAGGWYAPQWFGEAEAEELTWTVGSTNLRITVTERGTLESQKTVNGICELEGYENKIIFIAEEGSTVQKGDVVVRFDSSALDKEITEEKLEVAQAQGAVDSKKQDVEVTRNTGESEIAAAELELTLARLDLEKYEKGDYFVETNDLKGKISLAKMELDKAVDNLDNIQELVRKGFREPEQIRLAEQAVESATFNLERDQRQLQVLQEFDYRRKQTEFKAKADEAVRKLARAKSSAAANLTKAESEYESAKNELKLQEEDLAEELAQKEHCEIKAEQTGVVAYANEEWWSESRRIREGGTVYERQVVFYIPDMSLMQVEVKVHESEVKRIAAGQKAIIRVDAFANQSFPGTVKSVAQLSKSDGYFGGGVKEYTTIVTLDEPAQVALRPGMTAEVEILVANLSDVVAAPVQAIAEHRRKHFVYVRTPNGYERRDVEIGQTNNRMIVIDSGLEPGAVVALDARSRAAEEFADDDGLDDSEDLKRLEMESQVDAQLYTEAATSDSDAAASEPADGADADTVASAGDAVEADEVPPPADAGADTGANADTAEAADSDTEADATDATDVARRTDDAPVSSSADSESASGGSGE